MQHSRLRTILVCTSVFLSGCGFIYNSPTVLGLTSDLDVHVVPLTPSSVKQANQSPYNPRSLPAAFRSIARSSGLRGQKSLPPSPELPAQSRLKISNNLPDQVAPPRYRLGVGDVVQLITKGSSSTFEELSGLLSGQEQRRGYTVRGNGTISLPDVGYVNVSGKTLDEAETAVFQALAEKRIDPAFSLEITSFNSQHVIIGGRVAMSGVVPITLKPLTLGDALARVGGITTNDLETTAVQLYRNGKLYQTSAASVQSLDSARDLVLLASDAIYVNETFNIERALVFYKQKLDTFGLSQNLRLETLAELDREISIQRGMLEETRANFTARRTFDAEPRDYVFLAGEVARQGRVALPYEQHASLADVMYQGGGFSTKTGDPGQIYVIRARDGADGFKVTAWHLDATNIVHMTLATRMEMRPDDIIFIEEQLITKWSRAFEQAFPILINNWVNDTGSAAATIPQALP